MRFLQNETELFSPQVFLESRPAAAQFPPGGSNLLYSSLWRLSAELQPLRAERRSNPRLEAPPLDQERREGESSLCSDAKVKKVQILRVLKTDKLFSVCKSYTIICIKVTAGPQQVKGHKGHGGQSQSGASIPLPPRRPEGLPPPEVVWLHDEQQVSETEDFHLLRDGTLCSLMIQEVFPEDTGMYSCRASNRLGEDRTQCRLTVEEPQDGVQPWFITKPKAVRAVQGQHVLLSCAVAGDPFPGRVTDLHAGEYVITLRNQVGQCSAVACLSVTDGETDRSAGRETDRGRRGGGGRGGGGGGAVRGGEQQGSRVSRQEANEQQKKNLQQEEKTLLQKKKKEEEEEDQKLHFSSIIMDFKANLKGVKKAEDRKAAAPQVDFRAVLGKKSGAKPAEKNVEEGIKKTSPEKNGEKLAENNCVDEGLKEKKAGGKMAPEFLEKLCDVTVIDGQILRLQCRLNASDPPSVTWTLDGKTIKPSKFIVLANEGKALPEDEGEYKCRAENSAGKSESCCMVLVDDPTENSVSDKKKTKAPTSESEARIKKPTTKTPPKQAVPPQILQFPEDMKILAGEKEASDISIESSDSSSKLTISSGQQEHCGCYTIELRNIYSLRQAALNLTIVDKPDPPARVPASSDVRRSTLTLSWYGPTYDGGSAVQSYNLEVWDSVGGEWKHLASCNSTSYNVQDLLPERQYKFRVRAENMYGVGEPSAESAPVTVGLVDNDSEKEPDYRDVSIRTDVKVKELYDVEERLGTGKFGQVFKLVEKATKKVWAGKFIKAYSAKEKNNVRHEISIMNSLHHPKLVQCIDAFEGKSDIVMVLE
ncbi:Myosin light chain kinase smooth muscle, partial [Dissostichus eleginoides]